MTYFTANNGKY